MVELGVCVCACFGLLSFIRKLLELSSTVHCFLLKDVSANNIAVLSESSICENSLYGCEEQLLQMKRMWF